MTGFGYDHDDAWATNIELFKEFTDISLVLSVCILFPLPGQKPFWSKLYHSYSSPHLNRLTLLFPFPKCTAQGVRRLGAAAVDMCHVALGIVEAYWEYRLKPWDMAAGVLVNFFIL